MFRSIRRKEFAVDRCRAEVLLKSGEYGFLATTGSDGYPYGVPLNYVVLNDAIYFHGASEGHKLENLQYCEKVSFTVVGSIQSEPQKPSTNYESVIVFGQASPVVGEEKVAALKELLKKYAVGFETEHQALIDKGQNQTSVVKIKIQQLTGKSRWRDNF